MNDIDYHASGSFSTAKPQSSNVSITFTGFSHPEQSKQNISQNHTRKNLECYNEQ